MVCAYLILIRLVQDLFPGPILRLIFASTLNHNQHYNSNRTTHRNEFPYHIYDQIRYPNENIYQYQIKSPHFSDYCRVILGTDFSRLLYRYHDQSMLVCRLSIKAAFLPREVSKLRICIIILSPFCSFPPDTFSSRHPWQTYLISLWESASLS